jgi:imidazolonepropionase-like amidohydrolase
MTGRHELVVVVDEWFDGESRHCDPATFLIREGRIAEIVPGDRAATLVAPGTPVERGGFLMPGLVDAHVHLFLDGKPTDTATRSAHLKKSVEDLTEAARTSARQSLACGITLVRDAGDRHGINNQIRDESRSGAGDLSHVRSGGLGVKRPKRYGAFMARDVADQSAIRESVAELAKSNDEIKLILTGIIDFDAGAVTDEPQFELADTVLVVETAQAHERTTFAHCSGIKGLRIAVQAGVGSIEHGFFMDRETLAMMRDKQIAWTPTFCPVHFQWAHPEVAGWSPNTIGNLRRILDSHAEHLRIADELGVPLLLGTDAGSMGVEHGHALFSEIDRFLEAGIALERILAAGSSIPRQRFGLPHSRLSVGSTFDAVLFARSPFENVANLKSPLRIWRSRSP